MSADYSSEQLLQIKLYRPRPERQLVTRSRLLAQLEQAAGRRLILISAPAGYGKTMLVDDWLEQTPRPYAWLSLDENDNSLAVFVAYLVAALRLRAAEAAPVTWSLVNSTSLPAAQHLANIFLNELEALAERVWLVIDDYHLLREPDIHEFMARVVIRLPATLRLILISRSDPPFPLARLRARQQMIEIRAVDLRFTTDEASQLLGSVTNTAVPQEIVLLLVERTEGWPTGLQLAAIALRDSDAPQDFARRFAASSHRMIHDYLIDEVLATLSDKQRLELLRAALPDRFCAGLFEHLTGAPELAEPRNHYLQALWQSNLFLVALDDEGIWYRFHALFQMLLRQRLGQVESPESIAALHQRASAWFADQGLVEEAIKHALRSPNLGTAAQLLAAHLPAVLNHDDWRRLERWLRHFAAEDRHPAVLIGRAYLHHFAFRHAAIFPLVDAAEERLLDSDNLPDPPQKEIYLGLINTLRSGAYRNVYGDRERSLATATTARQLLPDNLAAARSLAESSYIIALQASGRHEEAVQEAQALLEQRHVGPDAHSLRLLLTVGSLHYSEADLPALEEILPLYERLASEAGHALSRGWSLYGLGWLHYQRDNLPAARRYFTETLKLRYDMHGRAAIDAYTGLALTYLAEHQQEKARTTAAELRAFLHDRGMVNQLAIANSLDLRLALAAGHYDPAHHNIAGFARDVPAQITLGLWATPVLTAVRAYLADGRAAALQQAARLLEDCRRVAADWHSTRQLIAIGALQALQQAASGDEPGALATLETAVHLAEPGGALRILTDAGAGLKPLLRRLLAGDIAPAYVHRLLTVDYPGTSMTLTQTDSSSALPLLPPARELSAALTNREVDVLLLLAQRLSNKEIASRLSLSPNTVKKHSINLYNKLGVRNRRQAVARAQDLGLLPEGL